MIFRAFQQSAQVQNFSAKQSYTIEFQQNTPNVKVILTQQSDLFFMYEVELTRSNFINWVKTAAQIDVLEVDKYVTELLNGLCSIEDVTDTKSVKGDIAIVEQSENNLKLKILNCRNQLQMNIIEITFSKAGFSSVCTHIYQLYTDLNTASSSKIRELESQTKTDQVSLQTYKSENENLKNMIQELQAQVKQLQEVRYDGVKQEKEIGSLKEANGKLTKQLKETRENNGQLSEGIQQLADNDQQQISDLKLLNNNQEEKIAALERQVQNLEQKAQLKTSEIDTLNAQLRGYQSTKIDNLTMSRLAPPQPVFVAAPNPQPYQHNPYQQNLQQPSNIYQQNDQNIYQQNRVNQSQLATASAGYPRGPEQLGLPPYQRTQQYANPAVHSDYLQQNYQQLQNQNGPNSPYQITQPTGELQYRQQYNNGAQMPVQKAYLGNAGNQGINNAPLAALPMSQTSILHRYQQTLQQATTPPQQQYGQQNKYMQSLEQRLNSRSTSITADAQSLIAKYSSYVK